MFLSSYILFKKFCVKIELYFIRAGSFPFTGDRTDDAIFPSILSTQFNNDVAFAKTGELSIGNSTVIYAITHSFITGDHFAYLLPLKFSGNGSIRKPWRSR